MKVVRYVPFVLVCLPQVQTLLRGGCLVWGNSNDSGGYAMFV
jgi:hypothetical protein